MKDYTPNPDADFQNWATNFVAYASAHTVAIGLTAGDMLARGAVSTACKWGTGTGHPPSLCFGAAKRTSGSQSPIGFAFCLRLVPVSRFATFRSSCPFPSASKKELASRRLLHYTFH